MSAAVTLRPEAKKKAAMSRASKDSVIDVQHLVKVYGSRGQEEIKAVNDVSFSVDGLDFLLAATPVDLDEVLDIDDGILRCPAPRQGLRESRPRGNQGRQRRELLRWRGRDF